MYHPYLFARRAELLALRDLTASLPISTTISPILEPVKGDSRDLQRCVQILGDAGIVASVIVNPIEGDFKTPGSAGPWRESLAERFNSYPNILPAFVCRPASTVQQINNFIECYN